MATNWRDFAEGTRNFAVNAGPRLFLPHRDRVVTEVLVGTVQGTAVDTGETRQGWHLTAEAPSGTDQESPDPVAQGLQVLEQTRDMGARLHLQNNKPAAPILEHGLFDPPDPGPSKDPRPGRHGEVLVRGGFSTQAPEGMLGDTVQRVAQKYGLQVTGGDR